MDHAAERHLQADRDHQVLEDLTVLAAEDRVAVRADHLHAVFFQDALIEAGHAGVQPGLSAERGQQRVDGRAARCFAPQDLLDRFDRDRLHVRCVGELRVGHDRRGIAVDQHDAEALLLQRAAGLDAAVVELAALADDDRAAADDEDGRDVGPLGHVAAEDTGTDCRVTERR